MSGLLDSKSRVLDTILTYEGRKQLSEGKLNIKYVSFSDVNTFYTGSIENGPEDATSRIMFEACSLPQDQITFQSDMAGFIVPMRGMPSQTQMTTGGQVLKYFTTSSYDYVSGVVMTGAEYQSDVETLLLSSLDNFKKNYIISSYDSFFDTANEFSLGPREITFKIDPKESYNKPVDDPFAVINLDLIENVFNDVRFSNASNFAYLPPINSINNSRSSKKEKLGEYPSWGNVKQLSMDKLLSELTWYSERGFSSKVSFDPTSNTNEILMQVFDVGYNSTQVLDLHHFGVKTIQDVQYNVFFAGKVMSDSHGVDTFIHLFTLVFSRKS